MEFRQEIQYIGSTGTTTDGSIFLSSSITRQHYVHPRPAVSAKCVGVQVTHGSDAPAGVLFSTCILQAYAETLDICTGIKGCTFSRWYTAGGRRASSNSSYEAYRDILWYCHVPG